MMTETKVCITHIQGTQTLLPNLCTWIAVCYRVTALSGTRPLKSAEKRGRMFNAKFGGAGVHGPDCFY